MEIIVDGQPDAELATKAIAIEAGALSLVAAVSEGLQNRGRAVVSLSVNGESVTPETVTNVLEGLAPSDIHRIDIVTREIKQLVEESLSELRESVTELPEICRNLAAVFQGPEPDAGYSALQQIIEIWSAIKTRQTDIAAAKNLDFNALTMAGQTLQTLHDDLNNILREAETALANRDTVLLGDLLEHELAPRAERETAIVELLSNTAEQSGAS